jgi:purine-nucleoside/S-methyl-5'-thioadenosine phosphorylase / adenosine deaminase
VLAADCVPIVLYDPRVHVLACAHSGWRGTVARTAAAAVRAMPSLGSRPADVVAAVGPAIPAARYQVGAQVAEAATETFGDQTPDVLAPAGQAHRQAHGAQWRFDLWAANRLVLRDAGVQDTNIHVTDVPTGPDSGSTNPAGHSFFSHRAQQPCGRFAAIARLDRPGRKPHHQKEGR